jgi:hypothetical protein
MKNCKRPVTSATGDRICGRCAHCYDYHELTAYEPRVPFMGRCPFIKNRSVFLKQNCENAKFAEKK